MSQFQTRTEALLEWLQERSAANGGTIAPFTNEEASSAIGMDTGRPYGNIQSRIDYACYRVGLPPLGLTANTPFAKAWGKGDRDWAYPIPEMQAAAQAHLWTGNDFAAILAETETLPGQAHLLWKAASEDSTRRWALSLASGAVIRRAEIEKTSDNTPYWVFVCNPKKWNIDRFLERRIEHDSWGVRDSDAAKFAPGQLALVRVGIDQRSNKLREGRPKLEAGIYAICEIESEAFLAEGAADEDWNPDERPTAPRPTVKIRYLQTFQENPLTIEKLRSERPQLHHLILDGFQGRSFPIASKDFRTIIDLLHYEFDSLLPSGDSDLSAERLADLEKKYLRASPEVKRRLSQTVERGPIGALLKEAMGFKCQLCDALGLPSATFIKPNGNPYVEAHHVMPVSRLEIGSLAASNVMILCATHHRQMHYGGIDVLINRTSFNFAIDGRAISIARHGIAND